MGSICIRADASIGGKSKGRRNKKDVVQGAPEKGSRFWKKMRFFLGCMLCSFKGEASSKKINKGNGIYKYFTLFSPFFSEFTFVSCSNLRISFKKLFY